MIDAGVLVMCAVSFTIGAVASYIASKQSSSRSGARDLKTGPTNEISTSTGEQEIHNSTLDNSQISKTVVYNKRVVPPTPPPLPTLNMSITDKNNRPLQDIILQQKAKLKKVVQEKPKIQPENKFYSHILARYDYAKIEEDEEEECTWEF